MIWEPITFTFALNGGLFMANNQYFRLFLRSSEGMLKFVYHRKHNKAALDTER